MEETKYTIVVYHNDNEQIILAGCDDKYLVYLSQFREKCSSFYKNNCAHICNERNELKKYIFKIKSKCPTQISSYSNLHVKNEGKDFYEGCTSECKYSKNTQCYNEGYVVLKSGEELLCEGNNLSKEETVTKVEKSKLQSILDSQFSEPRSSKSDNHEKPDEKPTAVIEFKSE
ncbi:hypothetical protein PGO_000665 [Plasmodium gonderi]|uniref:Variable surface protein n=1 Tax=Plasmodium gonderi TaxID=77519 RepID=A0A1Y1JRA3_PLAGO|nr:hypothetical protein PGO_000665 [Plasmodium gonderi]GAW84025.1 hypothetical protein PGO_000665 [Plasmodium gonderi]